MDLSLILLPVSIKYVVFILTVYKQQHYLEIIQQFIHLGGIVFTVDASRSS